MIVMLVNAIRVYELFLLIYLTLTYIIPVDQRRSNQFFKFFQKVCEPVLLPIRKKLVSIIPPLLNLKIDISPIILFLLLNIVEGFFKLIFY